MKNIELRNGDFITHAEICQLIPDFAYTRGTLVHLGYGKKSMPLDHDHDYRWDRNKFAAWLRLSHDAQTCDAFDLAVGIVSTPAPRRKKTR